MSDSKKEYKCPHCEGVLKRFQMPFEGGWGGEIHLACFNNECGYYQRGWDRMMEEYEAKASYRYRLNPKTGASSPLPVWSETAHLDRILEDEE